jgi:hypothetical protein
MDMKTSVPPAAIRAAPASVTAHPRRRRSVEMLETALGVLPLTRREAPPLVSCIIDKIPSV